jgi:hypothetical protein
MVFVRLQNMTWIWDCCLSVKTSYRSINSNQSP